MNGMNNSMELKQVIQATATIIKLLPVSVILALALAVM